MKTLKSIRLDNDLIARVKARAEISGRSFSNQSERLMLIGLNESEFAGVKSEKKQVATPEKSNPFIKPTEGAVAAWILEKGYNFDAESFMAHYESNGWKIGRNKTPMKSWKAACVTWSKSPQRADSTTKKSTLRDDLTDTSWAG